MNYSGIKKEDITNGEGIRTSLYVSGCTHRCKGCFNPETWSYKYGEEYTEEVEEDILSSIESKYIQGLSLLGGEPLDPLNQEAVLGLLRKKRERSPEKTVWCYTGYTYPKDLEKGGVAYIEGVTEELLGEIDVLVDGKFEEDQKDITLRFRGSKNQRVLEKDGEGRKERNYGDK